MKSIIIAILFSTSLMAQSITVAPNITTQNRSNFTNQYATPKIGAQIGFGHQININKTLAIQADIIASFNQFTIKTKVHSSTNGQHVATFNKHIHTFVIALPIQLRINAYKGFSFGIGVFASHTIKSNEYINPINLGATASLFYKALFVQCNYGLAKIDKFSQAKISSISAGFRIHI